MTLPFRHIPIFALIALIQTGCEAKIFKSPYMHPEGIIYRIEDKNATTRHRTPYTSKPAPKATVKATKKQKAQSVEQIIAQGEKEYKKDLEEFRLDRKLDREIAELEKIIKQDQIDLDIAEGKLNRSWLSVLTGGLIK